MFLCFHLLGMSSSQLIFICFRGVTQPPSRCIWDVQLPRLITEGYWNGGDTIGCCTCSSTAPCSCWKLTLKAIQPIHWDIYTRRECNISMYICTLYPLVNVYIASWKTTLLLMGKLTKCLWPCSVSQTIELSECIRWKTMENPCIYCIYSLATFIPPEDQPLMKWTLYGL